MNSNKIRMSNTRAVEWFDVMRVVASGQISTESAVRKLRKRRTSSSKESLTERVCHRGTYLDS